MLKVSGWMFTDAKNNIDCPRCQQPAMVSCQTPTGKKVDPPHRERVNALIKHPEFNIENYMAKSIKLTEIIRRP